MRTICNWGPFSKLFLVLTHVHASHSAPRSVSEAIKQLSLAIFTTGHHPREASRPSSTQSGTPFELGPIGEPNTNNMSRRTTNENETFSSAFDVNMEEIHAAGRQRRKLMRDAWEDVDKGWQALQGRLIEVGVVENSEDEVLRLNVGGSHVNVCRSMLGKQGSHETRTLASLFDRVWDKRLPRDGDGRIFLDESPTGIKHVFHTFLKASGTTTAAASGTAAKLPLGDGLPDDEKAYLPYVFHALGLPKIYSTVLEQGEFRPMSATILGWCPCEASGLELIYRASRDGRAPPAFHANCGEDKPWTVTLFRVSNTGRGTGDSVVGGFSRAPWTPAGVDGGYRSAVDAFVFMLKDGTSSVESPTPTTFEPVRWGMRDEAHEHAVWCHANDLPCFGDHDLGMTLHSNFRTLCTGNKYYNIPARSSFLSLNGHAVTEIEVFWVRLPAAEPASEEREAKSEANLGLIDVPTFGTSLLSAEGVREDDINTFGVSIADSLMEERVALRQAHNELTEADVKAAASANALAAVYGPNVAEGKEDGVVELSVHGTRMMTLRSTLQACPDSALAARFDEERWPATEKDVDERGRRVMDCSPSVFSKVLDVLRMRKRESWAGKAGANYCEARVAVKPADRAAFDEFVDMYFPGCESFIMDLVTEASVQKKSDK